jgi:hypothetical protein
MGCHAAFYVRDLLKDGLDSVNKDCLKFRIGLVNALFAEHFSEASYFIFLFRFIALLA